MPQAAVYAQMTLKELQALIIERGIELNHPRVFTHPGRLMNLLDMYDANNQ